MIRASNIKTLDLDVNDRWSSLLNSIAWAVRTTYHTTLEDSPAQLVYGRDMIYPLQYIAQWDVICKNKKVLIKKANIRENSCRVDHQYKVGDKVLVRIRA